MEEYDYKYFTDEYNFSTEIFSEITYKGLSEWGERSISITANSYNAVNYVFVNSELVTFIRQKLRRKKNRIDFLYHYLYFCSTIYYLKCIDKRFENKEFVPVNNGIMTSVISKYKYKEIVKNLTQWAVIESNESYQSGVISKGFKLLPPYNQNIKKKAVKDDRLNNKLSKHKIQSYKDLNKLPFAYQYLAVTNTWIDIDYKSATEYNRENYFSSPKHTVYDSNFFAISAYSDKCYRFKVDTFGYRAHSNLTNLKSDIRSFLSVDGEPLGDVDIKNSQPLFFYMHIKGNPEIPEDEKERYKQMVEDGIFYEFFMEKIGILPIKRNEIKKKIIPAIFFDKYRANESRYIRVFREEFPAITEYLVNIRKRDHKRLAQILQKAESKFIIEKAVATFIQKFSSQQEFISTIHDSIVVKTTMLQEAKQIILDCFRAEGINPKVSIVEF